MALGPNPDGRFSIVGDGGVPTVNGVTAAPLNSERTPAMSIQRTRVPGFQVDLFDGPPITVRGTSSLVAVGMPLDPISGRMAINSDRSEPEQGHDGTFFLHPAEASLHGIYPVIGKLIVVGVEQKRLALMVEELFGGKPGELRPVHTGRTDRFRHLQPVLRSCLDSQQDWGALYLESLSTLVVAEVLQKAWTQRGRAPDAAETSAVVMRRVVEYIEENLGASSLSLSELAAVAGLSPYHFARSFRRCFGAPPHRYVLERRLALAQRLLAENRLPLATICGFSSASHFSVLFRKTQGVSPRQYRADRA